ncbi:hypothetical protein B484DRAFT_297606, partial [Ochromonadaceae sp. CCMP2298]
GGVKGGMGSSKFACVKCYGVVKAPPDKVFNLFEDARRTAEYNELFAGGVDVEAVGENTKIYYSSSHPIFPFKPRDFCTIFHFRKLKDGTMIMLNRATEHPNASPRPGFVRGSIVLGATIVQPIVGNPRHCRLTMITQLDPGGII